MEYLNNLQSHSNWLDFLAVSGTSYLLIFAAEIGDKSQLVCMALAARYRAFPVMLGSALAFIFLNTIAVTFGVAIASWVPEAFISAIVAVLFATFGIHALRISEEQEDDVAVISSNRNIFVTTFLLITIAEFGDKTQLAVVALSSTSMPIAVWAGSTIALITTSALGVWAGRTLLQEIPITILHRISGVIFLLLAIFAVYKTYAVLS
ncbi:MAG: TMEM165/GDT1 family protein [gamma proteobacterium symbiont of Taylorina sp.]|nr:TMEM165/GDT1 family protein [gamma proteobacterium symbiont of Taylorina sp.]